MKDLLTQTLAKIIKCGWASTTLHFQRLSGVKQIVNLGWKFSQRALQGSNGIIMFPQMEEKREGKECGKTL